MLYTQIRPGGVIIVVDIVAIRIDISIVIHVGSVITIVARGPEPPSIFNRIPVLFSGFITLHPGIQ